MYAVIVGYGVRQLLPAHLIIDLIEQSRISPIHPGPNIKHTMDILFVSVLVISLVASIMGVSFILAGIASVEEDETWSFWDTLLSGRIVRAIVAYGKSLSGSLPNSNCTRYGTLMVLLGMVALVLLYWLY